MSNTNGLRQSEEYPSGTRMKYVPKNESDSYAINVRDGGPEFLKPGITGEVIGIRGGEKCPHGDGNYPTFVRLRLGMEYSFSKYFDFFAEDCEKV